METINDAGFTVLKGAHYVVVIVEEHKYLQASYDFIDGLIGKGYSLISISDKTFGGKTIGFTAHLVKQ